MYTLAQEASGVPGDAQAADRGEKQEERQGTIAIVAVCGRLICGLFAGYCSAL